eukprot:SAG31_NODE_18049_length_648_cov_1.377049_1_plen_58_part_01
MYFLRLLLFRAGQVNHRAESRTEFWPYDPDAARDIQPVAERLGWGGQTGRLRQTNVAG